MQGLIRNYLDQVRQAGEETCAIPPKFDIDTAVGEQLTFLGKRLGWPRDHCKGEQIPVFGFECDDACYDGPPVTGFCSDSNWKGCDGPEHYPYHFADDEFYRKFLKSRVITLTGNWFRPNLERALDILFGDGEAVYFERAGEISIHVARGLTNEERKVRFLYPEVLPVAPGVRVRFVFGEAPVFGFGTGFDGFCSGNFLNF
ncbi:MAG: DUF2612 domain-containing protein [Nitratireductor sp.]|nr:DUF2612 domain-containing protein [Nitratireductor sp.]